MVAPSLHRLAEEFHRGVSALEYPVRRCGGLVAHHAVILVRPSGTKRAG